MTYNIPAFPKGDTMIFLAMVAKSKGRVLKGGIPDKIGAARTVLKDWNHGKIPYYTVPPKDAEPKSDKGAAVIVSNFGKAFDLSKYDDAVMQSLKESDEMDFLQLEEDGSAKSEMGQKSKQLASYLNGKGDDEMDDDDEESDDDMEEDDSPAVAARAKLAQADDFNFDDM
jgi:nuclear GTP-binding protein